MFSFFKKSRISYKITAEILANKKLLCYGDLFHKLNIFGNEVKKYHYKNIRCNKKTLDKIENFLRYNLLHTKNKYSKIYTEKKLASMFSFDCLIYAPFIDDSIKDDIIIKLLDNDKDFTNLNE